MNDVSMDESPPPILQTIILGIILSVIVIVTIVSNGMICVSFSVVKLLRNPRHYLVVSLAIIDLCTGLLVSVLIWLKLERS